MFGHGVFDVSRSFRNEEYDYSCWNEDATPPVKRCYEKLSIGEGNGVAGCYATQGAYNDCLCKCNDSLEIGIPFNCITGNSIDNISFRLSSVNVPHVSDIHISCKGSLIYSIISFTTILLSNNPSIGHSLIHEIYNFLFNLIYF